MLKLLQSEYDTIHDKLTRRLADCEVCSPSYSTHEHVDINFHQSISFDLLPYFQAKLSGNSMFSENLEANECLFSEDDADTDDNGHESATSSEPSVCHIVNDLEYVHVQTFAGSSCA